MGAQALERLRGTYRHGEAQAPKRSGAPGKTPQNGESQASADDGDPGISTPTAPGALVFTNEYRSVRRTRGGTLSKNGVGRRAFVEGLDECPLPNAVLPQRAVSLAPHRPVLAGVHLSAGAGRRGSCWVSAA